MKKIEINNNTYELIKDYKNGFEIDSIIEKCKETDFFDIYDYILGDWAYGKLRLKGFFNQENPKCNNNNNYNKIDDYIKKYCAYECRYFIIKKK
ncbi:MAG: DUF1027 domain-containing protein [Firmicutes bacterium]|nr:DUF1027 domain-containing protein [Bacillota bacterium]